MKIIDDDAIEILHINTKAVMTITYIFYENTIIGIFFTRNLDIQIFGNRKLAKFA